MSSSGHLRRRAQRAATAPRKAWRRVYRYRGDTMPTAGVWATMYSAASEDAPYGPEDARFWDWVAAVLIGAIAIGLVAWLVTALT